MIDLKYIIDTVEKPVSGEWGNSPANGPLIKVIRNTNFNNDGSLNLTAVVEREIPMSKISRKKLKYGDILIEKSGGSPNQPVGRVVFFNKSEGDFLFSNFTSLLRPRKEVDQKYLFYLLYANHLFKKTLSFQNKTTGILNLQLDRYLKEIKIPVPLFSDQKRIATILDYAYDIRCKNKEILEKHNQLAKSTFLQLSESENSKKMFLKDICHINPRKSEAALLDKNTSVSFIPMTNVTEDGRVNLSLERELREVWNGFTYFIEGDVLFAKITPCMENGKGAIVKNLKNNIGFGSTEFHVLRPIKDKSNSTWLYYLTSSSKFRKQAEKNMTGSAGQKRVPTNFLLTYEVSLPSISIQNRFEEAIKKIDVQKELTQKTLDKSEDLFQSLLKRAFKGKL